MKGNIFGSVGVLSTRRCMMRVASDSSTMSCHFKCCFWITCCTCHITSESKRDFGYSMEMIWHDWYEKECDVRSSIHTLVNRSLLSVKLIISIYIDLNFISPIHNPFKYNKPNPVIVSLNLKPNLQYMITNYLGEHMHPTQLCKKSKKKKHINLLGMI